jgi:hypothetical protein
MGIFDDDFQRCPHFFDEYSASTEDIDVAYGKLGELWARLDPLVEAVSQKVKILT